MSGRAGSDTQGFGSISLKASRSPYASLSGCTSSVPRNSDSVSSAAFSRESVLSTAIFRLSAHGINDNVLLAFVYETLARTKGSLAEITRHILRKMYGE